MSRLALGTVQFGLNYGIANPHGQVSFDETEVILDHARKSGIHTLDTAIAYGNSEQRLGVIGIQDWRVVSKLPAIPEGCRAIDHWVMNAVQGSLERLRIKRLYGLLLHRPQQLMEQDGDQIYCALQKLKDDHLVQKVGVSVYAPEELDALCSRYVFDLVQAPFNLIDQRLVNIGWLSRSSCLGMELHVRSVFLQGLLLMDPNDRPRQFDRWSPTWSKYQAWLGQTGLTPVQACIRFAGSFDEIHRIVVGVDSLYQLKEILQAAAGSLPEVPQELQSFDPDLINPSHWQTL